MRVALYTRVSSKTQEKAGTIASQIAALRSHASKAGDTVCEEFVCRDEGVSGATLDRRGLDRLRDGAEAGLFDAVLVLSPDRLSRKYAYLILIVEEFERLGVPIVFLEQPPAEDPQSCLLMQIQGAVAEYERAKLAERYRRGKLHRARQGEVWWTSIPLGYRHIPRRDGVPPHVVIDEEQAVLVRQIFDWHANEGMTVRQIAKRLTFSGPRPPRGGSSWGETTIHRIRSTATTRWSAGTAAVR
jgi:site-specific DNA recombinase